MRLIIKATNIDLSDALETYINQKIGGLDKFLKDFDPELVQARVEIGKPSRHHKSGFVYYAEVNLSLPGKLLRAESNHLDLRYAVNEAKNELEKQIEKYKNKLEAQRLKSKTSI